MKNIDNTKSDLLFSYLNSNKFMCDVSLVYQKIIEYQTLSTFDIIYKCNLDYEDLIHFYYQEMIINDNIYNELTKYKVEYETIFINIKDIINTKELYLNHIKHYILCLMIENLQIKYN